MCAPVCVCGCVCAYVELVSVVAAFAAAAAASAECHSLVSKPGLAGRSCKHTCAHDEK